MLIDSHRLRPGDREAWERASAQDRSWATTPGFVRRVDDAEIELVRFAREPAYAGVSWGKDSMVLADLCARLAPAITLVWIRVAHHNPDCHAVRDAFLRRYPETRYLEHAVSGPRRNRALLPDLGRIVEGLGDRYLMGIRAEENRGREMYRRIHGVATDRFCAPLIHWSAEDVYAYLAEHDLPVHPSYAMSLGGVMDRRQLRVSSIGGDRGLVYGRREWEEAYYPDVLAQARSRSPRRRRPKAPPLG